MYEEIIKAMAANQAGQTASNPWIQGGQALFQTQMPTEYMSPWEAAAAGLAKGLGGGFMTGYGQNQVEQNSAQEQAALIAALKSENPAAALEQSPGLAKYAPIVLVSQLEAEQKLRDREQEMQLTNKYNLSYQKDLMPLEMEAYKQKGQYDFGNSAALENLRNSNDFSLAEYKAQLDAKAAGGSGLNPIAEYGKKQAAKNEYTKLSESNQKHSQLLGLADRLSGAVDDAAGGFGADMGTTGRSLRQSLGMGGETNDRVLQARALLNQAGPEFAAAARVVGSGATSDREFSAFTGTGPQVSDPPEVAKAKILAIRTKSQIGIEQNQFIQQYMDATGDAIGAQSTWQKYLNERERATGPVFSFGNDGFRIADSLPSAQEALQFASGGQQRRAPAQATPSPGLPTEPQTTRQAPSVAAPPPPQPGESFQAYRARVNGLR
jgi:hypothetical protein